MGELVDLRDAPAGPVGTLPGNLTDDLAACLRRFLEGTADEGTLIRARRAIEFWHTGHNGGSSIADQRLRLT